MESFLSPDFSQSAIIEIFLFQDPRDKMILYYQDDKNEWKVNGS